MKANNIQFRRYQSSDLEQVRHLHEAALRATDAFGAPGEWDRDLSDIEGHYLNNGGDFIVGTLDGEVVAMAAFRKLSEEAAEIKRMRVSPGLQGKGIGRAMLEMLEGSIKERGYNIIKLDTTVKQPKARKLYESAGYKEVRRKVVGVALPLETIFYEKKLS